MSESIANFRLVLRGYDPTQVDHHMNELAQAAASVWQEGEVRAARVSELKATNSKLKSELERQTKRALALEAEQMEAAAPTYTGLGERIASILTLVDHQAMELRTRSQADAANSRTLANEHALATRQDADEYARETRSAVDEEVARILEDARQQAGSLVDDARQQAGSLVDEARQQADSILEDADRRVMARQDAERQDMARREEAEGIYEQARASAAAAAIDFETTLAARREASALEFAAQVTAAEQQLAAVRLRSEQARHDSDRAQQEAANKIAQQLEEAMARAQTMVSEAMAKADRIRDNSERDLAAATQRRDSINAQITKVRNELAALGDAPSSNPMPLAEPSANQNGAASNGEHDVMAEVQAEVNEPQRV